MKAIVYVNGEKHSAWDSVEEAKEQIRVLVDYGYYKNIYYDEIDHSYPNGHYFV